jgi:phage-related protein
VKRTLTDKPIVWLRGEVKAPPFSAVARLEAGFLLRRLQAGESLSLPQSRPMPTVGVRCHELRVPDENRIWRIVYSVDPDANLILEVWEKKDRKTPHEVIAICRRRLRQYER